MLRTLILAAVVAAAAGTKLVEHKCFTDLVADDSEALECVGAGLDGPIPLEMIRLTRLKRVFLQDNSLTGTLPTTLWRYLVRLEHVDLSGNQIDGVLPNALQLAKLPKLTHLYLNNNQFEGKLHQNAFTTMPSLQYLSLSGNQLTGTLPEQLGLLPDLKVLRLQDNALTGEIPLKWKATNMSKLDVRGNELTGCVPRCIGLCSEPDDATGKLPDLVEFPCRVIPQRNDTLTSVCRASCPAPSAAPTGAPWKGDDEEEVDDSWGKSTTFMFWICVTLVVEFLCIVTYCCSGGNIKARIRHRFERHRRRREAQAGYGEDGDDADEGAVTRTVHAIGEGVKAAGESVKAASHVSMQAIARTVRSISKWSRRGDDGEGDGGGGGGGGGEDGGGGGEEEEEEEGTLTLGPA